MNRYALFGNYIYYPSGGWSDFRGSFDTVNEAEAEARTEWFEIVDLTTGDVVSRGQNQ